MTIDYAVIILMFLSAMMLNVTNSKIWRIVFIINSLPFSIMLIGISLYCYHDYKYIEKIVKYDVYWIDSQPYIKIKDDLCRLNSICNRNYSNIVSSVEFLERTVDINKPLGFLYPIEQSIERKFLSESAESSLCPIEEIEKTEIKMSLI